MKFFFDNGFPPPLPPAINALCKDEHYVAHLREHYPANTPDDEWITDLSIDGNWVIITKDNRISRNPVWKTANVTTIFITKGLQNAAFWDMAWKIIKAWPLVLKTVDSNPQGSIITIKHNSTVSV